jgi:formyltetrahydrofolate-dependent phosphoribosylglycinamide formyltransferase
MRRLAVFASGSGSNLQAIIDHLRALGADAPGTVALVVSDRVGAGALERARRSGIEAVHVPYASSGSALPELLTKHGIDLIALAGYLRHVPSSVTEAFRGRIVNIHPALLPDFGGAGMYGQRVHQAVIAAGARESGATVHYVDDVYDHGAVIEQERVPVLPGDTPEVLAARVLAAEHELYPRVVVRLLQQINHHTDKTSNR